MMILNRRWFVQTLPGPVVRQIVVSVCLIALTMIAYASLWSNGFVQFDDPGYVTRNPRVLQGLSWRGWQYAWTTRDTGNWIPLTWLSLQLDASLYGTDARGYHATNLLLHLVNGLLIFLTFRRMTGWWGRSGIVAAIFLVHPMHVESVAWISERKDVLSTFWLMLTILAYDAYVLRRTPLRYIGVCVCFAAGLLSKSMLVTTPLLLLLLDVWPLRRFGGSAVGTSTVVSSNWMWLFIEKVPLLLLSLLDGLITIQTQVMVNTVADDSGQTLPNRLGAVLDSYCWYLEKSVWPTRLIPYYQPPDHGLPLAWIAACGAFLVLMTVIALGPARRTALAFGWCWFVISLLPVIGLIRVGAQAHADRYSYIPHIGLLVGVIWPIGEWAAKNRALRRMSFVIGTLILSSLSVQTYAQVAKWRSNETLWTYTLSVDPSNTMAHIQLGNDDREAGRLDAAQAHYEAALVRWPESFQIQNYLSAVAAARGDVAEAERHSRRALEFNPASDVASLNLSLLLSHQKRLPEAKNILVDFLNRDPGNLNARQLLGVIHEQQNEFAEAWHQFETIIKADSERPDALTHGAYVVSRLNRPKDAQQLLSRLLRLQPDNIAALLNSGLLAEQTGERDLARSRYLAVIALQPGNVQATQRLRVLSAR